MGHAAHEGMLPEKVVVGPYQLLGYFQAVTSTATLEKHLSLR